MMESEKKDTAFNMDIMNLWYSFVFCFYFFLQGTVYEQLGGANTSGAWKTQEPGELGSVPQQPHWFNPSITLQAIQSQISVRRDSYNTSILIFSFGFY